MSHNHADAGCLAVIDVVRLESLGLDTGLGTSGLAALFAEQLAFQLEDLSAAIQAGSERSLSAVAHRCLGSSSLAGMERLSAMLRELEHHPAEALRDAERCLARVERVFADVMNELALLSEGSGMADVA